MKVLFVGGSGRSGTSAFVHRLQVWPAIGNFLDTELKFFSEIDGFWDLYWNFVEAFSPQRAPAAIARFERLYADVATSSTGFVGLGEHISRDRLQSLFEPGLSRLKGPAGIEQRVSHDEFMDIVAEMTRALANEISYKPSVPESERVFVEKTPHNLLRIKLLAAIPLDMVFIHVMRDPRIVAASLAKMPWGPGSLDRSCEWVRQYIFEMQRAFDWARRNNVAIHSLFIETVATLKQEHIGYIQRVLGTTGEDHIFDTLHPETLRKSADALSPEDVNTLNIRLGAAAVRMGYDPIRLGVRQHEPPDQFQQPDGLAGAGWNTSVS